MLRLGGSFNRDFEGARPPKGAKSIPRASLCLWASIFKKALLHNHSLRRHVPIGFAQWSYDAIGDCVLRLWFVGALMLGVQCCRAEATCVDPSALVRSTVGITRMFDGQERQPDAGLLGIRGTAWFLSPTFMVTAEHVAAAMRLSGGSWSRVGITGGENQRSFGVRVVRVAGAHTERIAVLELQTPFLEAESLPIRVEPLAPDERVVSLATPAIVCVSPTGASWSTMATSSPARRCSRCTTEMTDSCSITARPARRCLIARAAWLRLSATSSRKQCSSCRTRCGFRRPAAGQRRFRAHSGAEGRCPDQVTERETNRTCDRANA